MRWILAWSIQLRLLVLAAAAVLMVFGLTQLRSLPVDVLPEFSRPYVEVQTEAHGLSANEVEAMLTVPIEADLLNGVPWLDEIRSESLPGLSSIVLFFDADVDMMKARQVVQERLLAAHALPNVSTPPAMLQPVSSTNRVLAIGLTSKEHSLIDMSVLARWTIVPRLSGVPGVAQVSIFGQRKRQLQVQIDPEHLRDEGVTLQQVINTAGNSLWSSPLTYLDASTPGTGGWIETPAQRLTIQHLLPISTPEDLGKVIVEGTSKPLSQVATVVEDHQPLIGDAIIDGGPALMLVVEKFPWANTQDVTRATEEAVASLQLGMPGIEMDSSYFRPATYLDMVVENLSSALMIGTVLMIGALLVLALNWRTALISAVAVCVSALAAISVLAVLGVTINAMIIAGLAAALVVFIDDAVGDVQNTARRVRESSGDDALGTARTIFAAALEMRRPLLYATAVVVLGISPLLLLQGLGGAFAQPILYSYGLALLASMLVAMTVTPALGVMLLGDADAAGSESPLMQTLGGAYEGVLSALTRVPATAVAGAVTVAGVVIAAGFSSIPKSPDTLIPTFRERDIVISVDAPPGTSETVMQGVSERMSAELRGLSGVRSVSAHVGRAVMSDKTTDIYGGEVWVNVNRAADYDATIDAIRSVATGYAGYDIDVDTFLSERLLDETGPSDQVIVRVYGENMDTLRSKAEEVRAVMARVEGIEPPEVNYPDLSPTLEIEPDLARSQAHGLTPGDVRRKAATLLGGIQVGSLFEERKVFDVVVWGIPEVRHSVNSVENLLIDTPTGGHVRLKDVASARVMARPPVIQRNAVARHIDVEATLAGRHITAVSIDVSKRIREIDFPLEHRAEVLGAHAAAVAALENVRAVVVAAALGALLLLQAAFGSWSLAFLVMVSLPVALLGGVATGFIAGGIGSLGAWLGFLAVLGLAIRSALVLVSHYRDLENEAGTAPSAELVVRGTRERFGSIVTTAIVAAVVFVPVALFGNIAGLEMLHSLAVVVIGGVISSTLVSLLVVPALYLAYAGSSESLEIIVEEEKAA